MLIWREWNGNKVEIECQKENWGQGRDVSQVMVMRQWGLAGQKLGVVGKQETGQWLDYENLKALGVSQQNSRSSEACRSCQVRLCRLLIGVKFVLQRNIYVFLSGCSRHVTLLNKSNLQLLTGV
ncbi:hypothetical protein SS50377_21418 [Spironucleus salmonicida]|uniref:Uncharacterized protein n=1 Tax=Spironucleus salmonicida TaxID=348837 RepID=V6M3S7_9EUKA|nr:hypothetical protein SS50377_21418 [Spironucleus salmonicida]|eukprot:EST47959.1 Hypothetical protein SS50377_11944 [Spironucleus salmonicida]